MRVRQRQLLIGEFLYQPGRFCKFRRVEWPYSKRGQLVDETQKLDGAVGVVPSKKPAVAFRDDQRGGQQRRRVGKQPLEQLMVAIGAIAGRGVVSRRGAGAPTGNRRERGLQSPPGGGSRLVLGTGSGAKRKTGSRDSVAAAIGEERRRFPNCGGSGGVAPGLPLGMADGGCRAGAAGTVTECARAGIKPLFNDGLADSP